MNVAHTVDPAYPPKSQRTERPPKLLISVQNQAECEQVLDLGIDILDFKAPNDGPLAPVPPQLWRWAAQRVGVLAIQPQLSAALGSPDQAAECASDVPGAFEFAKMGIEGIRTSTALTSSWAVVRSRLSPNTQLVAVAYADHHAACCLAPTEVFRIARELGLRHLLIDTFSKQGRSSIQTLGWQCVSQIIRQTREQQQFLTFAGSVRVEDAAQFGRRSLVPNAFGIRGDITVGPRSGSISTDRISTWQKQTATLLG